MHKTTSKDHIHKIHGWGKGYENKTLAEIINQQTIDSEYSFHEIEQPPYCNIICSSENIEDLHFTLAKLSELTRTDPSRLLIIETQMVSQTFQDLRPLVRKTMMFRFHHGFSVLKPFANTQHGLRGFWSNGDNNQTPHIFYQATIDRLVSKKNKTKDDAKSLVDEFIFKIIKNYDTIIDLSNSRVYKRKNEIDLENTLQKLHHIEMPELFDTSLIKQALKEYLVGIDNPFHKIVDDSRLEFYNRASNKFKLLEKNTVFFDGCYHHPYITEHNMILFRSKKGKESVSFIVNIPYLKQRLAQNKEIPIKKVIPIFSYGEGSQRLLSSYVLCCVGRVLGASIDTIVQPKPTL